MIAASIRSRSEINGRVWEGVRNDHNPGSGNAPREAGRWAVPGHGRAPGARMGCLTMTYFRTGNPYYHRRATVSRSCSGWEGVVPAGCGRQALIIGRRSIFA